MDTARRVDRTLHERAVGRALLGTYFPDSTKGQQLVKHQLDSFNDFVDRKIAQVIEGFNSIDVPNGWSEPHGCYKHVLSLTLSNPVLTKPTIVEKDGSTRVMFPNEARLRNMTYSAPLHADLGITAKTLGPDGAYVVETARLPGVSLGRVPIMVRSRYCMLQQAAATALAAAEECRHDHGGYFVVNGNEKAIISQDRISENRVYVFSSTKLTTYSHIAEVRSVNEARFSVPKVTLLKLTARANQFGRSVRVGLHHVKQDVPLFILFRALGVAVADRAIVECVCGSTDGGLARLLAGSADEGSRARTQEEAEAYMAHFTTSGDWAAERGCGGQAADLYAAPARAAGVLRRDVLPHVGPDPLRKTLFLGHMVRRLLRCHAGLCALDDRDSYLNKRLDTPGMLMASLFRQYYSRALKDMRSLVHKEINAATARAAAPTGVRLVQVINKGNVFKVLKATTIEAGLKYGLATGNWGAKTAWMRQGVAQMLSRMTYMATMSLLRRVNTPIDNTGKLVQPRKLHPTQWGMLCPCETPEGAPVGLVKSLALLANVTIAASSSQLRALLAAELGVRELPAGDAAGDALGEALAMVRGGGVLVMVNCDPVGVHADPGALHAQLKRMKRTGVISPFTAIVWQRVAREMWLCTEGGRFVRPLLVVEQPGNQLALARGGLEARVLAGGADWAELVISGCIEYLDVEELAGSMVAMTRADLAGAAPFTHMEIEPTVMLGVVAGSIPYSDHNQAPRNTYQSAMGKQAIGVYATSFRHRLDTMSHVLNYPQRPLVSTHTARLLGCDQLPCGVNAMVAIACFTGFNQEDSVIVNRAALERGMFVSTFYRTLREQNSKNHSTGEEEFFCRPDPLTTHGIKPHNYGKLDADGFVPDNTLVVGGDVLMGKCMPQKTGASITHHDTSVALKGNERGYVDRSCHGDRYFVNTSGDGYTFAKVRLRAERVPTVGDKVSSRHGQKGTIGMVYRAEDMPFTAGGLVPDLIMNPHAIPSRMTVGQLLEALDSKLCAATGQAGDATPFRGRSVDSIARELAALGMQRHGDEVMHNPRTGEQVRCSVFIAPTYYQRLKHMVEDKVHSRGANGPVVLLTRQPAEGRSRDGGLRLGEMELECLWAHGSMYFLKERFMDCSDNYRVFLCRRCGMMCPANPERGIFFCRPCCNKTDFAEVRIPYASKLLLQEVQTMGIGARVLTPARAAPPACAARAAPPACAGSAPGWRRGRCWGPTAGARTARPRCAGRGCGPARVAAGSAGAAPGPCASCSPRSPGPQSRCARRRTRWRAAFCRERGLGPGAPVRPCPRGRCKKLDPGPWS